MSTNVTKITKGENGRSTKKVELTHVYQQNLVNIVASTFRSKDHINTGNSV